jgi:mannosyltransferase OCH1-like enzyme
MRLDRLLIILFLFIILYFVNQSLVSFEGFANIKNQLSKPTITNMNIHKISSNQFYDNLYTLEKEYLKKSFPIKKKYKSVIPLHIYQTWSSKQLPEKMAICVKSLKEDNPEFEHHLYDDQECRQFIKDNYDETVLGAYDALIPGAYRADLWRYCILYKLGGMYLDIKYRCVNGFKLIALTEKEHFVNDWNPKTRGEDICLDGGIYNAFMICKPNNKIMKKCIDRVVQNVHNNYYGPNSLSPTGPFMMRDFFTPDEREAFELNHYARNGEVCIRYKLYKILEMYPQYRNEQKKTSQFKHYGLLWRKRAIYALANEHYSTK